MVAIHFSSSIYLVNKKTFDGIQQKLIPPADQDEQHADMPWSVWNTVHLQPRAYTDGAADCNAGGLTNGDQVTLFHLKPKPDNAYLQNIFTSDIKEIQKQGKPVRAFLTGGRAYKDPDGPPSRNLHDTLVSLLEKQGLSDKLTQIWGRKSSQVNGFTDLLYDAARDSWYLYAGTRSGPVLSRQLLEETFEQVSVAEGDTLVTPEDGSYRKEIEAVLGGPIPEEQQAKAKSPSLLGKLFPGMGGFFGH